VYWIPVTFVLDSQRHKFGIMSDDSSWVDFRDKVFSRMQVDVSCAQLAYWVCADGCTVGDLAHLLDEDNWDIVMRRAANQFDVGNDVELEVVDVNCMRVKGELKTKFRQLALGDSRSFEARVHHLLDNHPLMVETYPLTYPTVVVGYAGLTLADVEVINIAGVHHADDFTLVSPQNLCMSTRIAPEKMLALYFWARRTISHVHAEKQGWIQELKAMRVEAAYHDEDSN